MKAQISEIELIKATNSYINNDVIFSKNNFKKRKNNINVVKDNNVQIAYIVELGPEGFIVFSPSKDLYPVIAYSEIGSFDYYQNEYNSVLTLLQSDLGCQLETLNSGNLTEKQKLIIKSNREAWDNLINNKLGKSKYDYEYGPNLPDVWGGVNSVDDNNNTIYVGNYYTPNHYSPGCVATSLSQILHMFEWPPIGQGEHTNQDNQNSSWGDYYSSFGRKWYNWDNMLDLYHHQASTDAERRAMGALAYQCGTALDMDYENSGSTSNVSKTPGVLNNYFRSTGHYEASSWFEFWPRLRENIKKGYAAQLAISDRTKLVGHAMVCDGWRQIIGEDKYYHMNNGWWGTCNAWYRIQVSFSDCGYDYVDGAVLDILPDPMFEDEVIWDTNDTKTFTIRWNVSSHLNWDAFELQEDKDNSGTWTTLSNSITDTFYVRTVPSEGVYKYRVRAKSNNTFYADSYSEILRVPVEKIVYLNFDGDDSFFLKDNTEPEYGNITDRLDIYDTWTIETWLEVDSRVSGTYPVVFDRKTVFSMYLISDADGGGDYGIRFVARDVSGNITASVQSDVNSNIFYNEWVHVAITRDGTNTKMFINGGEVDVSTDADFSLSSTTNALNIGARYWASYERYLDGRIDELRISDTARYASNFCPDRFYRFQRDTNTRVLLHMDAFIGSTVKEYSYNFINPTLRASTNDPAWASSTCPIITSEPQNMSLCEGGASFSIIAVQAASYQWQVDDGTGYVNVSDGGIYSGATTNTLSLSSVTAVLDGNKYRCIVKGSSTNIAKDCSKDALLTVYPACTTWDGTSWSNGEPNISMTATFAGDYTLPYDISANKITILSPYNVTVPPNLTLTAQSYFENHGTIILQSDANNIPTGALTLYGKQNNYGTMTAQRYISVPSPGIWGNWHLVALPFDESPLVSDIFSGTHYVYKNIEADFGWQYLYANDNLPLNDGFLVQLADAGQMISKTGTFGNGEYSQTLPLTSGTNLGWKLMKNPYPSPIDWNATSGWIRTDINPSVYTFDTENNGGSNQYSVWDGTVGTYSGSRYINGFQAYFVQANVNGAIVSTNNDIRVKNSDVSGTFLKSSSKKDYDIVKLQVTGVNGKKDEIVIYSGDTEGKTRNVLPLDTDAPDLFINGISQNNVIKRFLNLKKEQIIPISINSILFGEFRFDITEFNEKMYHIFLIDNFKNKSYRLSNDFMLDFTYTESEKNRFSLLFTKETTGINNIDEKCFVYTNTKTIFVHNENQQKTEYNLFTIHGKLIQTIYSDSQNVCFSDINSGVYLVKIVENDKIIIKKVTVN